MKVLIVPDIHLGVKSHGKDYPDKLNSRIQDKLFLMDFVYTVADDKTVDRIVLLGDIFEKEQPEPILITLFYKWLTQCCSVAPVDIIMGNHDFKRAGQKATSILDTIPAARIKNCKIYSSITTKDYDDLSITYIPFFDFKEFSFPTNQEAVSFISDCIKNEKPANKKNIALGHMAIEKSIYIGDEIADDHNELFLSPDTFINYNYTFMGHIHKPQILSKKPFVAHLGSLDKKAFDEGDKFICIYDSETNKYEYIKLPCRNLVDISISVPVEVKDTNQYILNEINKISSSDLTNSIVRLKVETLANDAEPVAKKDISKLLAALNVQHISEITEKKTISAVEKKIDIDETTNPYQAVDAFMNTIKADDEFKLEVITICKGIIKQVEDHQ